MQKKRESSLRHLNNPVEILGNDEGMVCGMKCVEMELGEPDESGRRRPVEKPDSEFVLDVDSCNHVHRYKSKPIDSLHNTWSGSK